MHPPARHSSRLGQRFQLALGAAAALAAISLSPGSAQAYVVTVDGVQYDVTTFTGSYEANTSKFAAPASGGVMPWWGSSTLASQFATAVLGSLGLTNPLDQGPYFAYSVSGNVNFWRYRPSAEGIGNTATSTSASRTFAKATLYATPGPLPLFGAAAAFGFSRQLRKRIKLAPAALGSALPLA
jgi:hypothetical protein